MRDVAKGVVEGLSIALRLAEQNRKNPKRIEPELVKTLQDLTTTIGYEATDTMKFEAR